MAYRIPENDTRSMTAFSSTRDKFTAVPVKALHVMATQNAHHPLDWRRESTSSSVERAYTGQVSYLTDIQYQKVESVVRREGQPGPDSII